MTHFHGYGRVQSYNGKLCFPVMNVIESPGNNYALLVRWSYSRRILHSTHHGVSWGKYDLIHHGFS